MMMIAILIMKIYDDDCNTINDNLNINWDGLDAEKSVYS